MKVVSYFLVPHCVEVNTQKASENMVVGLVLSTDLGIYYSVEYMGFSDILQCYDGGLLRSQGQVKYAG